MIKKYLVVDRRDGAVTQTDDEDQAAELAIEECFTVINTEEATYSTNEVYDLEILDTPD